MKYLAAQPYIKIVREVTSTAQIDTEQHRVLYLYRDRIVSEHRAFALKDVLDVSYRSFGPSKGLLYIHTRSGLYTYTVKTPATPFIERYNAHRQAND